jgi:hypothetical protein
MNSVKNIISSGLASFKALSVWTAILFFLSAAGAPAKAQPIVENFDNISNLPASGWFMRNNSVPLGSTSWFQGNPNIFPAQSGAPNSYIGANFNNTTGTNTISNWLLTPTRLLTNGSVLKFWTRTRFDTPFPDRLEVRLSTAANSTNVGTGPNGVGDFTTLLLTINPNLEIGGYPEVWTEYTVVLSGLPGGCMGASSAQGRIAFRYFVTNAGPTGDNSDYIGIDTVSYNTIIVNAAPGLSIKSPLDYNCDGKTDYVVARNTGGGFGGQATWFINNGTTGGGSGTQTPWGISTDYFVSGDFDGDGRADITVYRPGANSTSYFYSLRSSNGTLEGRQLGTTGDDPTVVGDYDGDLIDDYAVYRGGASAGQQSFWYYRGSATANGGITFVQFGQNGDFPAPGDYDGDNRNDFCVQRNNGSGQGLFLLNKSNGGTEAFIWGTANDLIIPGDYDGDGKDDFAVARASGGQIIWSVLGRNGNNVIHFGQPWGLAQTDFPVQGDYDGDGKTDIAIWRPGVDPQQNFFYIRQSSDGSLRAFEWGQQGDYPVATFNTH